ncbi:MAG TPA: polyprenyl diphosphate synthase [Parcubacteria group bacterium]|jgi:undecaprenyl diphosphate synthase|nr:polyprenyl diphosphate synthase [Parcubacteria group bacterium]
MNNEIKVPKCVGIIMDGNRRWARNRDLPLFEGHRQGGEILKNTIGWARDLGVEHIIFYTFSTENWKRAEEEVSYLIDLIGTFITKHLDYFHSEGGVIHYVGDITKFSADLQDSLKNSEEKTKNNKGPHVYFALNYGGRAEILSAVKRIVSENPKEEEITEEYFGKFLQTGEMPDPDVIIRTSGEIRLSGFLPWQSVYSELFFTKTLWPDFSKQEFESILEEFSNRDRRRGK